MQVAGPVYYRRYTADIADADGEEPLLRYLETLNEIDWEEFLYDVATGHSRALNIIQPRSGEELVGHTVNFIQRTSPAVQRIAARAIERLVDGQVVGRKDRLLPDQIHSLFSVAAMLNTGINVQFFATIANHPKVDVAYRVEAGRVIANHGEDAPVEFWKHLNLSLTPALAPVVLLGLAKHDAADAMAHVAESYTAPQVSPALKLALRDLLLNRLQFQGIGTVDHLVDLVSENIPLKGTICDLQSEYPELDVPSEIPQRIVRDELRRFSASVEIISPDGFDASALSLLNWAHQEFMQYKAATIEGHPQRALNATETVLRFLHESIRGPGKTDYLIAVCRRMLKVLNRVLSDTRLVEFETMVSESDWGRLRLRDLVE